MNRKGFTLIELISTIIILMIFVLIIVFVIHFTGGNPIYEYTDLNNNKGTAYYCSSSYGSLHCSNGLDQIQVKEYHFIHED